jgi:hypothetical protein
MYRLLTNEEKFKVSQELVCSPFRIVTDGEKL